MFQQLEIHIIYNSYRNGKIHEMIYSIDLSIIKSKVLSSAVYSRYLLGHCATHTPTNTKKTIEL